MPSAAGSFAGVDTATTDTRIYWLVAGTEPGLRLAPANVARKLPGNGSRKALGTTDAQAADAKDSGLQDTSANIIIHPPPGRGTSPTFAYTLELKERLLYFSSLLNGDEENYFGQLISSQPVTETLTTRRERWRASHATRSNASHSSVSW